MPDPIDEAQAVNELHQDVSLRNARAEAAAVPPGFNGVDCVDCDEPVEEGRLKLKLFRCLECARALEIRRKTHAA